MNQLNNDISILKKMLFFWCILASNSVWAEYQFSKDFVGGLEQAVGQISGNQNSLVASKQAVPVKYLNDNDELECHLLFKVVNNQWQSLGDVGANGNSCAPLSGVFPVRAVEAFGSDICIGGDFTDLGGVTGLSYFACYSDSLGWYQPNGIGNGPNNSVYSIDVDGSTMFLGGQFTQVNAGTMSAKHVVKTQGFDWQPLYSDANQTDNGVSASVQTVLSTTSYLVALSGSSTYTWNSSIPEWVSRGSHNGSFVSYPDVIINGSTLTVTTKNATSVAGDPGGSVSNYSFGDDEWSEFGMSAGVDTDFGQLAYGLGPLYSSGDFTSFDANARGLAWYNTNTWEPAPMYHQLGDLNIFQVLDMQQAESQFCLLNQGSPTDAELYWNTVVCYDGNTWRGDNQAPLSNVIQTIGAYQNNIYHGGDFNYIGDKRSPFISELSSSNRWTNSSQLAWTGAGQGHVRHLEVFNGELYATGRFDQANGTAVEGIARFDGTDWTPVISGLNAYNGLMTVWDNKLIINGFYNSTMGPVLAWDGSSITEVGNFINLGVFTDFTVYQNDLVVSNVASGVARLHAFDGNSWQTLGGTASGVISTLEVVNNDLYVGGDFSGACNGVGFVAAENIYFWNGTACETLGAGVSNSGSFVGVNDIQAYDGNVIVTGRFNQAGNTPANSLAMWNGDQWQAFDQGLVDGVDEGQGNALWMKNNTLFISGFFEQAGNALSHNFAALDLDMIFEDGFE